MSTNHPVGYDEGDADESSKGGQRKGTVGPITCERCGKNVYAMEMMVFNQLHFHKWCFRCVRCNSALTVGKCMILEGEIYCSRHFSSPTPVHAVKGDPTKKRPERERGSPFGSTSSSPVATPTGSPVTARRFSSNANATPAHSQPKIHDLDPLSTELNNRQSQQPQVLPVHRASSIVSLTSELPTIVDLNEGHDKEGAGVGLVSVSSSSSLQEVSLSEPLSQQRLPSSDKLAAVAEESADTMAQVSIGTNTTTFTPAREQNSGFLSGNGEQTVPVTQKRMSVGGAGTSQSPQSSAMVAGEISRSASGLQTVDQGGFLGNSGGLEERKGSMQSVRRRDSGREDHDTLPVDTEDEGEDKRGASVVNDLLKELISTRNVMEQEAENKQSDELFQVEALQRELEEKNRLLMRAQDEIYKLEEENVQLAQFCVSQQASRAPSVAASVDPGAGQLLPAIEGAAIMAAADTMRSPEPAVLSEMIAKRLMSGNRKASEALGMTPLEHGAPEMDLLSPILAPHEDWVIEMATVRHGTKDAQYKIDVTRRSSFYKNFFYNEIHANYFSRDKNLDRTLISLKKEPVRSTNPQEKEMQYRVCLRAEKADDENLTIPESWVRSWKKSKKVSVADVINFAFPKLELLTKLATPPKELSEDLQDAILQLDEDSLVTHYKFGIVYAKEGQTTENEMLGNVDASPAFEEFLDLIGTKTSLRGFTQYRGGLDVKGDTTGTQSVFTLWRDLEIMFHVSTLLPYQHDNEQQIFRKAHIGNDIVVVVFVDGKTPYNPASLTAQFPHVFIVVQPIPGPTKRYRVGVATRKGVPHVPPEIVDYYDHDARFRDFLLAKMVNGEHAAYRAPKFKKMQQRTRRLLLTNLFETYMPDMP